MLSAALVHIVLGANAPAECPVCEPCAAPLETTSGIPLWMSIGFGTVLLMLSGCFSGLTLGLLGLDKIALKAIADSPVQEIYPDDTNEEKAKKRSANSDREAAQKITPLRKKSNLLLCTLLLGNVMVNVMIPILLADLTGGMMGFIFSTCFIVIFGEIVPQATCSRYALQIGALSIPLVQFFKCVLLPLTVPIAYFLDLALGADLGQLYDTDQLEQLLLIHLQQGHLVSNEYTILQRALALAKTEVSAVMTFDRNVYSVGADDVLTESKLIEIWQKGHSRIPVIAEEEVMVDSLVRRPEQLEIASGLAPVEVAIDRRYTCIGVLFAKDLITVRPEDGLTARQVVSFYSRGLPPTVRKEEKLDKVLENFRRRKVHLALVEECVSVAGKDPQTERIGIVTLEDVLEHLVGQEFVDEHDVVEDVSAQQLKRTRRHSTPIVSFRSRKKTEFEVDEATGVAGYLLRSYPENFAHLEFNKLVNMVMDTSKHFLITGGGIHTPPQDSLAWLYRKGTPLSKFTFILGGDVRVISGDEQVEVTLGPFRALGIRALSGVGGTCDFDAYCTSTVRIIQIDHTDMVALTRSTSGGPRAPPRSTRPTSHPLVPPPAPISSSPKLVCHQDPREATSPRTPAQPAPPLPTPTRGAPAEPQKGSSYRSGMHSDN
eukprot:Hpha_TRINITY_DN14918_c2_g1::TRINITY_DN14918_c2_g1_i1::g.142974::m.142974/K16302/CNNM; metal transporter CNNM